MLPPPPPVFILVPLAGKGGVAAVQRGGRRGPAARARGARRRARDLRRRAAAHAGVPHRRPRPAVPAAAHARRGAPPAGPPLRGAHDRLGDRAAGLSARRPAAVRCRRHGGRARARAPGPPAVTAAELEAARALARPGDTDAVTFSWADPGAQLYGLARLGRGAAADGALQASAL